MKTHQILEERAKTHGEFTDNAEIAQMLKATLRAGANWNMRSPIEKEAMEMICHKLARWVNAPLTHIDNPVDIAGYAQLVVDRYDTPQKAGYSCSTSLEETLDNLKCDHE